MRSQLLRGEEDKGLMHYTAELHSAPNSYITTRLALSVVLYVLCGCLSGVWWQNTGIYVIVSCKTEWFLPHSALLEFIFYLHISTMFFLRHNESFNNDDVLGTRISSQRFDCGQMAKKKKLEALVVSRADRKPDWKLAMGSWHALRLPFHWNLSSRKKEEETRRKGEPQGVTTQKKPMAMLTKVKNICNLLSVLNS